MEQAPKEYTNEEISGPEVSSVLSDTEKLKQEKSHEFQKFSAATRAYLNRVSYKLNEFGLKDFGTPDRHQYIHNYLKGSEFKRNPDELPGISLSRNTIIWFQHSFNEDEALVIERYDVTTSETSLIRCRSLEEFYSNLLPEELKKGEKIGKEIEREMRNIDIV